MPRIRALHWSAIPRALTSSWAAGEGPCFATWPDPVDYDACFEKAGFEGFADTDDEWSEEFSALVNKAVEYLRHHGPPTVREGEEPVQASLFAQLAMWLKGKRATLLDWIVCPTENGKFPPCIVDFGAPVAATLRTAHGHPILWIQLPPSADVVTFLQLIAGGRPMLKTSLDWQVLA